MNSIRKFNIFFFTGVLFCALHLGSCTYDKVVVIPEFPEFPEFPVDLDCDENIGAFQLLSSSLDYTPYGGKDSVVFVDSLGTELVFSVKENPIDTFKAALIKHDVFVTGDTVRYCYQTESKSFFLENAQEDLKLKVSIDARPDYDDPAPGKVSDEFNIWYIFPDPSPFYSIQVYFATIDQRTGSFSDHNIEIPQLEVFGKTFTDVEKPSFNSTHITIWYNRAEGIVSFIDANGKKWRWDGFR
jgi:hypothetical protein